MNGYNYNRLLLLVMILTSVFSAALEAVITFESSVKIGTPGDHGAGFERQVKINVVAPGQVDVAWRRSVTSPGVYYACWNAAVPGNPASQQVRSTAKCTIGGIGRNSSGDVLIGYTDSLFQLNESTNAGGSWALELLTDSQSVVYKTPSLDNIEGYSINPVTSKGEFIYKDSLVSELRHVYRSGSSWAYTIAGAVSYNYAYPEITHAPDGTTYVIGNRGSGVTSYIAGPVGSMTTVSSSLGSPYKYSAIDEYNGTLYALATDNWWPRFYTSTNSGATWIEGIKVPMITPGAPPTGTSYYMDYELAVGPNGEIAALYYDKAGGDYWNLFLAYRDNLADTTWDITQLSTATGTAHEQQFPDVAFDSAGELYVAYYEPSAGELYLKSTYLYVAPPKWNYKVPVGFGKDYAITGQKSITEAKLNIVAPGEVDIAWLSNTDSNEFPKLKYLNWQADVDGNFADYHSTVRTNVSDLGGIGRGLNDEVRIGYRSNSDGQLYEKIKTGLGWDTESTGFECYYVEHSLSYSVNPVTGLGEFAAADNTGTTWDSLYHVYQSTGVWTSSLASTTINRYSLPSMVHDPNGYAYISACTGGGATTLAAGIPGSMDSISGIYAYSNSDIALHNGDIYVISRSVNYPAIFRKQSGGSWVLDSTLSGLVNAATPTTPYGKWGYSIAVGPSGEIAVLYFDIPAGGSYYNVYLGEKDGFGVGPTWEITQLSFSVNEDALQLPDVKFDSQGNLYVVYYEPAADQIYMVTNVPVPTDTCEYILGHGGSLEGDINNDCDVDMSDLFELSSQWLKCSIPLDADCVI